MRDADAARSDELGEVSTLLELAKRGLSEFFDADSGMFPHTVRLVASGAGREIRPEGTSARYTAIAALGLGRLPLSEQRRLLKGSSAKDIAAGAVNEALRSNDVGAVALACWAAAETGSPVKRSAKALVALAEHELPLPTVEAAWAVTALLGTQKAEVELPGTADAIARLTRRLLDAQHESGLFPHVLPQESANVLRRHVGCFADQVYPIQALARYHGSAGGDLALDAANLCAERVCAVQGSSGQWWWHYDTRNGQVVEGYPVYSVHQHAMAPMALLELADHGGFDFSDAVAHGLGWLSKHPEVATPMVSADFPVVWRSVRRREPRRSTRTIRAALTAVWPGAGLPGLDSVLPPGRIDYECRPYELGWLLYAWLSDHARRTLPPTAVDTKGWQTRGSVT